MNKLRTSATAAVGEQLTWRFLNGLRMLMTFLQVTCHSGQTAGGRYQTDVLKMQISSDAQIDDGEFLFFFCWIFLPLLTLLTTKFSCPAWTLFLAFNLPHSNGFSHTSQTNISPLQSVTRLPHHHSSCTVCFRAQYWGPFSSSYALHLSPIS